MTKLETGQKVRWKWGNGTAEGKVSEIFTHDVTEGTAGH